MKDKVLCAITDIVYQEPIDEEDLWYDLEQYLNPHKYIIIAPLIDHPHNDVENGQKEVHYHYDTRYEGNIIVEGYTRYLVDISKTNRNLARISKGKYKLQKFELQRREKKHGIVTPIEFISKSKLKHKCIHKGKCPHRGMDLSNISPELNRDTMEWEIECPLHGLRFNANTKNILNDPTTINKRTQV